jgi:hypothetical protein
MVNKIPAMTPDFVHEYLEEIGRGWSRQGCAVELGSWLGATAAALLKGLVQAEYDRPMYCYDRWQANRPEAEKAARQGVKVKEGQDLRPIFQDNVHRVYRNVWAIKGNIGKMKWIGVPIEICLFDAPKRNPVFSHAVKQLSPWWVPGVTILGLLDYTFYDRYELDPRKRELFKIAYKFINRQPECFTFLKSWPGKCSCAFFRFEGGPVNAMDGE